MYVHGDAQTGTNGATGQLLIAADQRGRISGRLLESGTRPSAHPSEQFQLVSVRMRPAGRINATLLPRAPKASASNRVRRKTRRASPLPPAPGDTARRPEWDSPRTPRPRPARFWDYQWHWRFRRSCGFGRTGFSPRRARQFVGTKFRRTNPTVEMFAARVPPKRDRRRRSPARAGR